MLSVEARIALLKKIDLFQNLPEEVLEELAQHIKFIKAAKGETIIRKGEMGDAMYIVQNGRVKVHDEEHTITTLKYGDIFGELSLLDPEPRSMSVTAVEYSGLYMISRKEFNKILKNHVEVLRGIMIMLIRRVRQQTNRMIGSLQEREEELKRMVNERTKDLYQKNKELLQAQKYKQQFLANMSHEVRTPINAISGMVNLLLKDQLQENQSKYLNAIKKSTEHLVVLVDDILDFSKIEAGKIDVEAIDFELHEVVEQVYNTLKLKADEKRLTFKYNIDKRVPRLLVGDPVRLNQILVNLAGNAIKFTSKGKVEMLFRLKEKKGQEIVLQFRVNDTGIGIPKEKQAVIFDAFTQASSDTTRNFGGTGLGLAISKQLLELQNGSIGLESEEGKGTTFTCTIPYKISEKEQLQEEKSIPVDKTKLKGLKILLAEDNEFNVMVAVDTLQNELDEIVVDVAINGEEAVSKVKSGNYDLVLMDLQMPVMDGFEAAEAIRKLEDGKNKVPIIALTANVLQSEVDQCSKCGMNGFISKPFEPDELVKKIAQVVQR